MCGLQVRIVGLLGDFTRTTNQPVLAALKARLGSSGKR